MKALSCPAGGKLLAIAFYISLSLTPYVTSTRAMEPADAGFITASGAGQALRTDGDDCIFLSLPVSGETPVPACEFTLAQFAPDEKQQSPVQGPPAPHAASSHMADEHHVSFGKQIDAIKWETGAMLAYMTITQLIVTDDTASFHFQDEGWFGKNTKALGMDKLTHAFNAYIMADFLQHRIEKRTGANGAVTAALVSSGLQLYSELFDAHKVTSGFSVQDVIFNTAGAGLSVMRNTVPGMREKLDFRLMLMPNSDIYTFKGRRHYAQQRYLFALTLAGFERFENSPLRFVELHAGYYGKNFTAKDRAAGREPRRRVFFGVGLNVKELFFKSPRSEAGKIAGSGLDYFQIPYTAVHTGESF